MLLADVAFRAPRVENYDEENSDHAWLIDVYRLEEERLVMCVRTAKYLEVLRKYYDCNVHDRSFMVSDLVLHKKQKTYGMHKLSSPWEGPYMVKVVTRPRSYRLCDLNEVDIPNSWHIDILRHFYP
jgi:hypothetical protein